MINELSYKQAANQLGVSHATVRNRLARLRGRLRIELDVMRGGEKWNIHEPSDEEFNAIERQLFERLTTSGRKRTRRHRWIAAGTGLALIAGGTTAGVILANQQTRDNVVYCYSAPDTNSRFTTAIQSDGQNPTSSQSAITQCAAVWQIGFFESTSPPTDDGRSHTVPPLAACLRNDGVLAVFPLDDLPTAAFCQSLKLNPAP